MSQIIGTNLRVRVGNEPIAQEKSCTLNLSTASIATTNKDSADWETSIAGRKSWTVDASFDVDYATATGKTTYAELLDAWLANTNLVVSFCTATTGDIRLAGSAYITKFTPKGEDQAVSTVDVTFQGTGILTKDTVPA